MKINIKKLRRTQSISHLRKNENSNPIRFSKVTKNLHVLQPTLLVGRGGRSAHLLRHAHEIAKVIATNDEHNAAIAADHSGQTDVAEADDAEGEHGMQGQQGNRHS